MTGTVLVTGGAGYVGAHCCKHFAKAGWNVVVFDNFSRGWRDFARWGDVVEGDLLDAERLRSCLQSVKPDVVAHFAALAYVGESVSDPNAYFRVNFTGACNLVDAMRAAEIESLVFSSTCATYGNPVRTPLDETHPQNPVNPYGWSKLFVEKMLAAAARAYGIRSLCLRYFNAAGADPDAEIGERHDPETHLIPLALRSAMRDDFEMTIFGEDYPTPDGTAIRDYIHVVDLADAHERALAYLKNGGQSDTLNLGTGHGASVREIVQAAAAACGRAPRVKIGPRREGDPPVLVAAAGKALDVLGWKAQRSDIAVILEDSLRWHELDGYSSDERARG